MSEKPSEHIKRAVRLLCEPGQVYELRCPRANKWGHTYSGYFNDLAKLAAAAKELSGSVPAVYVTLNPVSGDLLARAANRVNQKADCTTADKDVVRRRRLLIDADAIRPAGISSTDEELRAAAERIGRVRDFLDARNWPRPLTACSGNGGHLVYGIDLPNDNDSTQLLSAFLQALAARFNDERVKVDVSVYNASRISKLYGTKVMKGDHVDGRPHRFAQLVEAPDELAPVPVETIRDVAGDSKPASEPPGPTPGPTPPGPTPQAPGQEAAPDPSKLDWLEGFFKRHDITVLSTKGESGTWLRRWEVPCPFCGEQDRAAAVLLTTSGRIRYRCLHDRCSGGDGKKKKTWGDFKAHYDPDGADNHQKKREANVASRLTTLALEHARHFVCDGKAYLAAGPLCFPVLSTPCRRWLGSLALRNLKIVPNDQHLKNTVQALDAVAHDAKLPGEVHRRFARVGDTVSVDLGDDQHNVVTVTKDGWRVAQDCPVHFLRGPNQAPQVVPVAGGSVTEFFRLMKLPEADHPLLLGFLLDCCKGRGPYTVLLINGEQGSAKSTMTKMVRQIVDPARKAPARYLQRDVMELSVAAEHNAIMCYDNVSSLPQWLSDALASLATGSGFGCRKFFAQDEEVIFGEARPIIINGIPDFAESPDLLDRAIKITMPSIPEESRKTDEEARAEFDRLLPGLLGDLLGMVAKGLGNPDVACTSLPRIASSAKWIAACGGHDFAGAYATNRRALTDLALENSDLAQGLLVLFGRGAGLRLPWEGTATQLLEELNHDPFQGPSLVPHCLRESRRWPRGNTQLSTELNRIAPDLARKGLIVERVIVKGARLIRVRENPARPRPAPEPPPEPVYEMPLDDDGGPEEVNDFLAVLNKLPTESYYALHPQELARALGWPQDRTDRVLAAMRERSRYLRSWTSGDLTAYYRWPFDHKATAEPEARSGVAGV